jgi:hypothetical protein
MIVAPLQRGSESLVARQRAARAAGQESEAIVEASPDLVQREHLHPCRRQLDGEGDAVQAPADVYQCLEVPGLERKVRHREPRAIHE